MVGSKNSRSRPASTSTKRRSHKSSSANPQRRQATLYDAVAGRISSTGFIPSTPRFSKYRDTASSSNLPVPPEEVLFRRKGAPERYEENDIYWADRHLNPTQTLPESDLVKSIHTYASHFYGRVTKQGGAVDFESFDETALLCMGVLLEEMAGHVLGETGDLAFVEGEDVEDVVEVPHVDEPEEPEATGRSTVSPETPSDYSRKRKRKKRKIKHDETSAGETSESQRAPSPSGKRRKREKGKRRIDFDDVG